MSRGHAGRPGAATRASDAQSSFSLWAFSGLYIGFFMVLLDTGIVNVALPRMMRDLPASLSNIIWVNSLFLLTMASLLLIAGRLGDRFGPKQVFIAGLAVFASASLACGLATTVWSLVAARGVQGAGAALMVPQIMAIIHHAAPAGRRGRPMGVLGATAGLAIVSGPLLGGALVDLLGWQWVFFVNLPLGFLSVVLTARLLPGQRTLNRDRLDFVGMALFTVGLAAVVFGVQEADRYRWGTVAGPISIWMLVAAGIASLVGFAVWQRLRSPNPLLSVQLLRRRNFSLSVVANTALGFAMVGSILPIMLYLQSVRGFSPIAAGALTVPMALATGATSAAVGRLVERVDGRLIAAGGFLSFSAGLALLAATLRVDSSYVALQPPLILAGVGLGAVFGPLATLGTLSLPRWLVGGGSGLFHTMRQVGNVVGTAGVGLILQSRLSADAGWAATAVSPTPDQFDHQLVVDAALTGASAGPATPAEAFQLAQIPSQPSAETLETVLVQYGTDAVRFALILPAVVLLLGLFACLAMSRSEPAAEADLDADRTASGR